METVQSRLEAIIKSVVNLDICFKEDSELTTIGIDSMQFIKIVIAIENEFDFEFDDEYINSELFKTIGDIAGYIKARIS